MTNATILQPTYMPWLGYFEMLDSTELFVILDHVQFSKQSWQQRNRIKTRNGTKWLTVPVKKSAIDTPICEINISYNHGNPLKEHKEKIINAYSNAPYFDDYFQYFDDIFSKPYQMLRDLNVDLIRKINEILGIETEFFYSSELDLNLNLGKTKKLIEICEIIGIDEFYEANAGQNFIDISLFNESKIKIRFQKFEHPIYPQLYNEFVPYMSVIDLLFNLGDNSLSLIRKGVK